MSQESNNYYLMLTCNCWFTKCLFTVGRVIGWSVSRSVINNSSLTIDFPTSNESAVNTYSVIGLKTVVGPGGVCCTVTMTNKSKLKLELG